MLSELQKKRIEYKPKLPKLLSFENCFQKIETKKPEEFLEKFFPKTFHSSAYKLVKGRPNHRQLKVGVVFSGGPAAGGHNVIAAIFDAGAEVIGFLDGPSGIIENRSMPIKEMDAYRNQGGFDLIGSGRTKIETKEQLKSSMESCMYHKLDGLVIIGGDDSNTNAAFLAEYFLEEGCKTSVIGVPKTIDGDLRSEDIEISFGFDSACKTYAEMIGNVARDALSSKKYYHFIKVMGRSASHIALECALLTQPNLTLISEERKQLNTVIQEIADLVEKRSKKGKNYGVILIPEGLVEFLGTDLPVERDPHGNIEISKIETEKWLIDLVQKELNKREFKGKFNAFSHFFGYEGRSCMPTNFDANYCYALGSLAYLAIREELTGMICSIQHLNQSTEHWEMKMVPLVNLIHLEIRLGKEKPVIKKALVDINGKAFLKFASLRKEWELQDHYLSPGPIQFFGDEALTDSVPITLNCPDFEV